jgi:hypothetical protein
MPNCDFGVCDFGVCDFGVCDFGEIVSCGVACVTVFVF